MKLHEKIYYCRKKAGLSQEALAEKAGVSRQAVSKWETGDSVPELSKLPILASVFGVTADWLLSEDEPQESKTTEGRIYEKTNRFEDWADRIIASCVSFFKRRGWILGIIIIIYGVFRIVNGFLPVFSLGGYMPSGFAPMIIYSIIIGIAITVGGIILTVVLRKWCKKNSENNET